MITDLPGVPVIVRREFDGIEPDLYQMFVEYLPEVVGEGVTEGEAWNDLIAKLRETVWH